MCWYVQTCLDQSKVFMACNTLEDAPWVRTTLMNDYSLECVVLNVYETNNLKDYRWEKNTS